MRVKLLLIIALGMILGGGCQAIPASDNPPLEITSSPESVSPTQGEEAMTLSVPTPADQGLQNLIQKINEDLAGRLSISADDISIVEVTEVEWSDSSMDCPEPGMSYLQVITPGYRIILQANDQPYEYHTNRDSYFVYCDDQAAPTLPKP